MTSQTRERYVPEWTLGDRLRRIRRDMKLNQTQFAERLGVKEKRYVAWESGTNSPPSDDLLTIARRVRLLCGQDASLWLLGMEPEAEQPDPEPPAGDDGEQLRRLTEAKARRAHRRHGENTGRYLTPAVAA